LCYAVEDAKTLIDKKYKERFKERNVKAYYSLALFERQGKVWATTLMQNVANAKDNNFFREEKGNYWFTEDELLLEPFLADQLKEIGKQIKPESIKRDYAMLIDFLKQQSQIPSETVDYILNLIVNIFSSPEPFLSVIMTAFADNMQALYSDLKSEKWYIHLQNLSIITGVHHEGVCLHVDTPQFFTTADPFSHKKRRFIPVGEFFENMLKAPESYYEKNFEAILDTIIPKVGTPPDVNPSATTSAPESGQATEQKSNGNTEPTPRSETQKKKNVIPFIPRKFPYLHSS
jgi:hypothetical protein